MIDNIKTPRYDVGEFLSSLLKPLTQKNELSLSDPFEAVSTTQNIPKHLFIPTRHMFADIISYHEIPFRVNTVFRRISYSLWVYE